MRLYLIRHLVPFGADGTCYGRTDLRVDSALEAAALRAIREVVPSSAPVFSSPLQRCARLATAISKDVRYDARLVELDFGDWEMQPWDDIPRAEIDAWAADVVHYRPGGGESVLAMANRVCAFYDELGFQRLPEAVVVCHAGVIRLLSARQRGLGPEAMARQAAETPHAIGYGEVIVLDCV
jgi:alpha-ribazole phosphatase